MEVVPWNREQVVLDGEYRALKIGDLCLIIAKRYTEWHISEYRGQVMPFPDYGSLSNLPLDLSWIRWEASDDDSVFLINPSLPNLPVISQPSSPVSLPPGAQARFFIGVPAYIKVMAKCNGSFIELATFPMVTLSYTWKGVPKGERESTTRGEVCVSLQTKARRVFDQESFSAGSIICTIEISNHKKTPIQFSRIRLDTAHLFLYLSEHNAWANYCRYDLYENSELDTIIYASGPPREAGRNVEISPPRVRESRPERKSGALDMLVDQFKLRI